MNTEYTKAFKTLRNGDIVVFPTDTVSGIGCSMENTKAIEKLYDIKDRSFNKPTAVLISDLNMFHSLIQRQPDPFLKKLTERYWPGKLTIAVNASEKVPSLIMGNNQKVGVRMPGHVKLLELIKNLGCPLVATSANFKGKKAPIKFSDVDPEFLKEVDFYISEDSKGEKASTVIDYFGNGKLEYIRKGSVTLD